MLYIQNKINYIGFLNLQLIPLIKILYISLFLFYIFFLSILFSVNSRSFLMFTWRNFPTNWEVLPPSWLLYTAHTQTNTVMVVLSFVYVWALSHVQGRLLSCVSSLTKTKCCTDRSNTLYVRRYPVFAYLFFIAFIYSHIFLSLILASLLCTLRRCFYNWSARKTNTRI